MTDKLILLCDTYPLGEAYEKDQLYFGISFAPALDVSSSGSTEVVKKYMSPWEWTIEKIHVFTPKVERTYDPIPVHNQDATQTKLWYKKLEDFRDSRFLANYSPELFQYRTADGANQQIYVDDNSPLQSNIRWHASLLNFATLPYPLGQLSGTIYIFKIPVADAQEDFLIAAPSFSIKAVIQNVERPVLFKVKSALPTGADEFNVLQYEPAIDAPQVAWEAYTRRFKRNPPTMSDGKINLTTGWIQNSETTNDVTGADWTVGLKGKVCQLFNIPQLLSQYFQERQRIENSQVNPPVTTSEETTITPAEARVIVYGISDLAGVGIIGDKDKDLSEDSLHRLIFKTILESENSSQGWAPIYQSLTNWWSTNSNDDPLVDPNSSILSKSWATLFGATRFWSSTTDDTKRTVPLRLATQMYDNVSEPRQLNAAMVAIWGLAFKGTVVETFWTKDLEEKVQNSILPGLQLRRQRELELCEPVWAEISGLVVTDQETENILQLDDDSEWPGTVDAISIRQALQKRPIEQLKLVACIIRGVRKYIAIRFGIANGAPYQYSLPSGVGLKKVVTEILGDKLFEQITKTTISRFCLEKILQESANHDDLGQAETVEKLAFAIDSFGDQKQGIDDFRRYVNGVGILMRKEKSKNWNCLNLADVGVNGDIDSGSEEYDFEDLVSYASVVPLTLHSNDAIRRSFICYDNLPLVGDNPDSLASSHGFYDEHNDSETPMIVLRNAYRKDGKTGSHKLIRCIYGMKADGIGWVARKGGALPKEMVLMKDALNQIPYHPAHINLKLEGLKFETPQRLFSASYLRRTPFGSIRVTESAKRTVSEENATDLKLPPIPDNVFPLAGSLLDRIESQNEEEGKHKSNASINASEQKTNLILLVTADDAKRAVSKNTHSFFEFYTHIPACDFRVWERCNDISAERFKEGFVKDKKFKRALAQQGLEQGAVNPKFLGFSLDDPHVEGLVFRLKEITESGESAFPDEWVERSALPDAGPEDPWVSGATYRPVKVVVQSKSDGLDGLVSSIEQNKLEAKAITVNVLRGKIYTLEIFSAVTHAKEGEFHPNSIRNLERADGRILFPSQNFTIEVATCDLPSENTLRRCLVGKAISKKVKVDVPEFPSHLTISLILQPGLEPSEELKLKRYISRCEVNVQRWRWQGRPLPSELPTAEVMRTNDWSPEVTEWDGLLFGERLDDDLRIHNARVDLEAGNGGLLEQDIAGDLSSHYYRFSVRGFSRYEGIFGTELYRDSRGASDKELLWNRIAVPSTITGTPKAPVLRMLLPLTEALIDMREEKQVKVSPCAAIMAVCDESGCTLGLGEMLEVQVAEARAPEIPYGPGKESDYLAEFGPDPVLSMKQYEPQKIDLSAIGPIGHTFDTDTVSAVYTHSSFIIEAPQLKGADADRDLGWSFAKLRFRRKVPNVLKNYELISSAGNKNVALETLYSEWTPATWCQFLPASSFFNWRDSKSAYKFVERFSKLSLVETDASGKNQTFLASGGSTPRIIIPKSSDGIDEKSRSAFIHCVLLTQYVLDAFGNQRESFLGLFRFEPASGELQQFYPIKPLDRIGASIKARLLEIQMRTEDLKFSEQNLAEMILLGTENETEKLARITRVSEPCQQSALSQSELKNLLSFPPGATEEIAGVSALGKFVNYMYLEIPRNRICIGFGTVIDSAESAERIPLLDKADKSPTSVNTRRFDWNNIDVNREAIKAQNTSAPFVNGVIDESIAFDLLYVELLNHQNDLRRIYPEYDSFPNTVKTALLEMIHEIGSITLEGSFSKFAKAIRVKNWSKAAAESERSMATTEQNAFVKQKLLAAGSP